MSASRELSSPSNEDGEGSNDDRGHNLAEQSVEIQSDSSSGSSSESIDASSDEEIVSGNEGATDSGDNMDRSIPIKDTEPQAVATLGLEGEYRAEWQDSDIIMVHGLCDDRDTVWKELSNTATWTTNAFGDSQGRCAELYFSYNVVGDSLNCAPIFDVNGIEKVAISLLNDLVKAREKMRRPLKYIARDVGGLIVKSALILARRAPSRYPGIAVDTSAIIFHNCPTISDNVDKLEDVMLRVMNLPGSKVRNGFSQKALRLARESYAINNDFVDINMSAQARTWNLVSAKQISNMKDSSTGYPLEDVQGLTTHPLEGQYRTPISHTALANMIGTDAKDEVGIEKDEDNVEQLREHCITFFRDMADEDISNDELYGPQVDAVQDSAMGRQVLLSQCPPIRPLPLVTSISKDPFWSWLRDRDVYKAWIDSGGNGTRMLYLHGNVRNLALLSEQVFSGIYDSFAPTDSVTSIFYFRFHRHDCRYNNTWALMISFLAQLASRISAFAICKVARIANFARRAQAVTLTDIIQLFEDMRAYSGCQQFCWMISCIDECVDQELERVFHAFRQSGITHELKFRVIVTGSGDDKGQEKPEGATTINLDDFPGTVDYRADDNTRYVDAQGALQRDLALQMGTSLPEIQKWFDDDIQLKIMVFHWLHSRCEDLSFGQDTLTLFQECTNLSPAAAFQALGKQVPPNLQNLRDTAVKLARHAFHPLTIREMASALALNEMKQVRQGTEEEAFSSALQRAIQSLQKIIPGQLVVKHNEVHLAHNALSEDASDTVTSESHYEISKICLEYLELPSSISEMRQLVDQLQDAELPVTPARNSFTAYAVQYFPHHYKCAGPARPLEDVFRFFQNRKNMLSWSEAHYALANFSTRVHCGYSSLLPILARTGLLDLIEEYLRRESSSNKYDSVKHRTESSLAIIEACRLGDEAMVRFLVNTSRPSMTEFRAAIAVAVSNGNSELIKYLIDEASGPKYLNHWPGDGEWAEGILFRVAWLGQQEAVQKLIHLGVNVNPKREAMQFEGPPLFVSMRGGHKIIIDMLLHAGADTTIPGPFVDFGDGEALTKAAACSDSGVIDLILRHETAGKPESRVLDRALQWACWYTAFAAMRTLLKEGAQPDRGWEDWDTFHNPLFYCVGHGNIQCVQVLLQHNADVNVEGSDSTPLTWAVERGHIDIARMLLLHGADPNRTTDSIELPLLIAVDRDNLDMVELLLDHHADIEKESETNARPNTALALAAKSSSMEVIHCLRRRGANINHMGKASCCPLWSACWRKPPQLDLVKELLQAGADINKLAEDPDTLDWGPIHAAYDFPEILTTLLDAGAKINQLAADASTVLYLTSKWNYENSVKTLLAYNGSDQIELDTEIVDESDSEHGMTPLCTACQKGYINIMRLLLEAGANPAHRMPTGSFPLLLCLEDTVENKDIEATVRMLLEYLPRSDLNKCDNDGNTALHTIRAAHKVPVVRFLVNMGADTSIQNNKGSTPFLMAVEADNCEVIAYFLSRRADIDLGSAGTDSPLRLACAKASLDMVKLLVEAGADFNERDKRSGESILQTCIADHRHNKLERIRYLVEDCKADVNLGGGRFQHPIIVNARTNYIDSDLIANLMVEHGADVNAKDDAGRRVIHHAMLQETDFLVEELLTLGVEVEALDLLGRNALHYAAASGNAGHVRLILMSGRIAVDSPDSNGWTPLMWACRGRKERDFDRVCGMLLRHGASLWARGRGFYGEWSPLKTARYFDRVWTGYDRIMTQLEPSNDHRKNENSGKLWDDDFHKVRKGWDEQTPVCFGCFSVCYGIRWRCKAESECPDFYLCFVCYSHRDVLHPQKDHYLEELGEMYSPEPEPSNDSSQGDDDSDVSSQASER